MALLWSCRAPATISDADAEPSFINITRGLPLVKSPFDASKRAMFLLSLPFVETISPELKKWFVTSIDWPNKPPGLFLRSKINPEIFF